MPPSAEAIPNAKAAKKPFKLSDGGGLFLFVAPNGARCRQMAYHFDGKQIALTFGMI